MFMIVFILSNRFVKYLSKTNILIEMGTTY
jgi:hypothetical protein